MLGYAFSLPNLVGVIGSDLTKFERSAHLTKYFFPTKKHILKTRNSYFAAFLLEKWAFQRRKVGFVLVFSGSANCIFSEATEIYIYKVM